MENMTKYSKPRASILKRKKLCNATIRGWVSSSPTVERLKAVADYFGVTVDELLSESKE